MHHFLPDTTNRTVRVQGIRSTDRQQYAKCVNKQKETPRESLPPPMLKR